MASTRKDSSTGSRLLSESTQQSDESYEDVPTPRPSNDMEKRANPHYPGRSFDLPLDGNPELVHQLNPQAKKQSTWEQESVRADAMEKRIKRHWYPPLLLSIALNALLLASVFYIIYDADYYSESRSGYFLRACLIVFVPLFPLAILLFWPWAGAWKSKRDAFSQRKSSPRWAYIVNILNAIACFLTTVLYLIHSAIPKYNTPVWETAVDFPRNVAVPAIAMITVNSTTDTGQEAVQFRSEAEGGSEFIAIGASGVRGEGEVFRGPDTYQLERTEATKFTPVMVASIANISRERTSYGSALQTLLQVRAFMTYNSTISSNAPALANSSLEEMAPVIIMAAYDPRLTLEEAMYCNIVQPSTPLAFESVTYLMSVSQISDRRGKMQLPDPYDPICERVYTDLLPNADPPLTIFDLSLMSSAPTTSDIAGNCDIANAPNASCLSVVSFSYGSQFVTNQRSVPGKSKQGIWIDCAAIVGAVQFFAWFLYTFFQP